MYLIIAWSVTIVTNVIPSSPSEYKEYLVAQVPA